MRRSLLFGVALLAGCASTADNVPSARPADPTFVTNRDPLVEQSCAGLPRSEGLMCRADRRLISARARGDSTLVGCLSSRGRELRAVWRRIGESREQLAAASRNGNADAERYSLHNAERSLEQQYARLDDCPGSKEEVAADSVRVVRPALAETDDFPR